MKREVIIEKVGKKKNLASCSLTFITRNVIKNCVAATSNKNELIFTHLRLLELSYITSTLLRRKWEKRFANFILCKGFIHMR